MANCTSAVGGLINGDSHKSTAANGTSTKQIKFFVLNKRIKTPDVILPANLAITN